MGEGRRAVNTLVTITGLVSFLVGIWEISFRSSSARARA